MDDYNVKQIGDFPSATDITDDDVLLAEQAGKTRKLSGKVLKDFCRAAISAFTTRAETAATAAEAAKNAAAEIEQLIGEKAGVASFNGRAGIVVPQSGDYTAAMVGAVPKTVMVSATDLNTLTSEGRYFVIACTNSPGHGFLEVKYFNGQGFKPSAELAGPTACISQTLITWNGFSCVRYGLLDKTVTTEIAWEPWEWVDPPMELGGVDANGKPINEYRTTERWNGKPVYVRIFRCAPLPDSSSTTFDVFTDANVAQIVEVHGVALHNDSANSTAIYLPWTSDDAILLLSAIKYNNGKVSVFIKTDSNQSAYTGYVTIKYTKN